MHNLFPRGGEAINDGDVILCLRERLLETVATRSRYRSLPLPPQIQPNVTAMPIPTTAVRMPPQLPTV